MWAEQYDRDLDDLFSIQSEIAQKVAERLNAKVTSVVPTDIQTDDLMTSGLHKWDEHRPDVAAIAVHQNSHRDVLILLATSCA